MSTTTPTPAPLAVRQQEAARMLGICPRTLFGLTAPRGPIPAVKLADGRRGAVLYAVDDLRAWLRRAAQQPAGGDPAAD